MIALVCWALLGAPTASFSDTLSDYRGRTVVEISVDAPKTENQDDLLELIDLEAGYLLRIDDVETAMKRLYTLGRFSSVEVFAETRQDTIALRFVVLPIERLGDLEIKGLSRADEDALREALRFRPGDEIDSQTGARISSRATAHLVRAGFPQASASLRVTSGDPGEPSDAILTVREGPPTLIDKIVLVGDVRAKPWILTQRLASQKDAPLNQTRLREDRTTLLALYRERGFLAARIKPAKVGTEDGRVVVTFEVQAGPRVAFHITGNRVFKTDELMRFAPRKDAPFTEPEVEEFVRQIQNAYVRLGRFTTEVKSQGFKDAATGVARYLIRIREGPPMEVDDIEVTGSVAIEPSSVINEIEMRLKRDLGDVGILDRLSETDRCLLNVAPTKLGASPRNCRPREVKPEKRWVPSIYASALDAVSGVYQNLGYLSVQVGPPTFDVDGEKVRVRIPIVEGVQTFIRSIRFEGNQAFESSELLLRTYEATEDRPAQAPIQPGAPFSRNGVEDARIALIRSYRDRGYLYGRIFGTTDYSEDGQWADISYRFDEGPQVRINRILVRGNRFTNETVIRSRISFEPGDLYRLEQALNDQRSISELGVFDSVRVRLIDEERPSELKDLVAEVKERNRQPIEIAPGISTAEGPRLQASYTNINLFGTAGQFSVLAKINQQVFFGLYGEFSDTLRDRFDDFSTLERVERVVQLGLRSPRYVNVFWQPTLRAEFVTERSITLSYAFDSNRVVAGVDLQPSNRLRISIAPEVSVTDLSCADVDLGDVTCLGTAAGNNPTLVALDEGERRAFKIGPSIQYDARDNPFFPTSGFFTSASLDYSVGRSREQPDESFIPQSFFRGEATFSTYFGLGSSVLALSARGGHIRSVENDVPIFERFFLGGRTTLRGFQERALIAEDCEIVDETDAAADQTGDQCIIGVSDGDAPITQGGQTYALLKAELRVPISGAASLGFFVDSGNLWFADPSFDDIRIRYATGAGLRYNTPVGPLALDVGVNPSRREVNGEDWTVLHFTVGVF